MTELNPLLHTSAVSTLEECSLYHASIQNFLDCVGASGLKPDLALSEICKRAAYISDALDYVIDNLEHGVEIPSYHRQFVHRQQADLELPEFEQSESTQPETVDASE